MKIKKIFNVPLCLISLGIITLAFDSCNNTDYHTFGKDFIGNLEPSLTADTVIYLDVINQALSDFQPFTIKGTSYYASIGRLKTPEFGTIESSSFIQFKPSLPFSFPTTNDLLRIDSCFLLLKYSSLEGDSLSPSDITVHEIMDDRFVVNRDKNYNFANNIIFDGSKTLGQYSKSLNKLLQDSGSTSLSYFSGVLRVPIDTTWAKKFITNDNTTGYANDSGFMSIFKGFVLKPSSGMEKSLMNFSLTDTNSYFAVYYSYEDTKNKGNRIVNWVKMSYSSVTCAFATDVKRDRTGSLAGQAIQNETNNKKVVLQPSPNGSVLLLKFPDLSKWANEIVSINRAELLLEEPDLPSSSTLALTRPSRLYVDLLQNSTDVPTPLPVGLNDGYVYSFLPPSLDFSLLEGYYISIPNFRGYKINVSRYLQSLILPKPKHSAPYAFRVTAPHKINYNNSSTQSGSYTITNPNLASSGVYLYGQDITESKSIRIRIVYLKL